MTFPILLFFGFSFLGIVHSVFFSIRALKNNQPAELLITLFLLVQSLIILEYVFYWSGLYIPYPYLCNISLVLLFLFGPLLFLYFDFLISEQKKWRNYFLHFLPALLILLLLLPYFFSTANLKLHHTKMIRYLIINFDQLVYLTEIHLISYFFMLLFRVYKSKRVGYIKTWLYLLLGLFGFYILCYVSYYILVKYSWFTVSTDYFVSSGMCLSILAIIYFSYGKEDILNGLPMIESVNPNNVYFSYKKITSPTIIDLNRKTNSVFQYTAVLKPLQSIAAVDKEIGNAKKEEKLSQKYKNSGLTHERVVELALELKGMLESEKLYRESELKLETVATKMGITRHEVSQVINQYYGVNFFEFINILRIHEAKELLLLSNKSEMNVIEVAYSVGYNTKNTFNAAFQRIVGKTPTEFRRQK